MAQNPTRPTESPADPPTTATPAVALPIPNLPPEFLHSLVSAVVAAVKASGNGPNTEQSATMKALELMANTQAQYAEEFKRQVRKSNRHHPNVSVYTFDPKCDYCLSAEKHPDVTRDSPRGPVIVEEGGLAHPKPKLKHDVYFCNGRVFDNDLTVDEVKLYNLFDHDVECHDGDWWAKFKKNGTRRELHVMVPYRSHDEKSSLPSSLAAILAELLYGNKVIDPAMVIATQQAMQKQIDDLKRQLESRTPARA